MQLRYVESIGKEVSRLCYGTLTIGPLQRDFDPSYGASLLYYAYRHGINFFDTGEIYDNYQHFKELFALGVSPKEITIATKSYAYNTETAKRSLDKALVEMKTDRIDMFLLHEQESVHTLRGHSEAIEYFMQKKEEGIIGAFGISTHHLAALEAALKYKSIEVIHPIANKKGIGWVDGTMQEAEILLKRLKEQGKFIYGMKPLGGGHLIADYDQAIDYVMGLDFLDSIAMGMQSTDEIDMNILKLSNNEIPSELRERIRHMDRKLMIHDWCEGCGLCVQKCQHGALEIVDGKAIVKQDRCVFCGYCASVCPQMCIKVI
jgi:aryl-alcohol dehydrogenase-like predicted oxidoreductase